MGLMDTLRDAEDELTPEPKFRDVLIPTTKKTILKASFLNIDLYSDSLIYTWLDKNRVKFSMDGSNNHFKIKKSTKFYHKDIQLPDHILNETEIKNGEKNELMLHIERQFKEELNEYFEVNGFMIDSRKIIFYIKDKR